MKRLIVILFSFIAVFSGTISAQSRLQLENDSRTIVRNEGSTLSFEEKDFLNLNSKYSKALLFSTIVPGSGQVYLGNDWKGAAVTLAFWGSAVTAIISHNNFLGREDRIKLLTVDYEAAGTYKLADKYWNDIQFEKASRDNDYDRRNIFTIITAAVYVLNIADILFFTEDQSVENGLVTIDFNSSCDVAYGGQNKLIDLKFYLP